MKQAKILDANEYKRLLAATKMTRHADRNRIAVVFFVWSRITSV